MNPPDDLSPHRVAVVGGGVSGLMAAWELSGLGFRVELFEASKTLGGLASSFDFDGFRVERFYHFICRTDQTLLQTVGRLGLRDRLQWKRTQTSFFYQGRQYPFSRSLDLLRFSPLSVGNRLRFGLSILRASHTRDWKQLESISARDWLIDKVGEDAYSIIWDPLLRIKFHAHHDEISAAWMWHRIHRVARSRRTPLHAEEFGYLDGGADTFVSALETSARSRGVRIHLGAPVDEILERHGSCTGVRVGGEFRPFDSVIGALPLTLMPRILPPSQETLRRKFGQLQSIGVVCMILRLKEPISRSFWMNVNDDRISFNGIIEYTNLNEDPAFEGKSILYIPFYLDQDHPRYFASDEELLDEYATALKRIQPRFSKDWIESYRVFRAPHAQPICGLGFSEKVPSIATTLRNLYVVESSQLYPADRIISGNLRLAQDAVALLSERVRGGTASLPFAPRPADVIPA